MFECEMRVRLQHTDAAGVVFYAEQFGFAHAVYEAFLDSRDLSLTRFLEAGTVHLPIIHAEADYQAPLHLGDHIRLQLTNDRIGDSSFALTTRIIRVDDGTVASNISTVHVAIGPGSGEKIALPERLRAAIEEL